MRRRVFLLAVLLSVRGVGAEKDTGWKFIYPGEHNVGGMTRHPGEGRLALVERHGVWQFEPAMVKTRRDTSPAEDESSHGLVVSSSVQGTIAPFRMPEIKAGKVNAAKMNFYNVISLWDGGTIAIRFGRSVYKMESMEEEHGMAEPSFHLRKGTRRPLLPGMHMNGCFAIGLIWAWSWI